MRDINFKIIWSGWFRWHTLSWWEHREEWGQWRYFSVRRFLWPWTKFRIPQHAGPSAVEQAKGGETLDVRQRDSWEID